MCIIVAKPAGVSVPYEKWLIDVIKCSIDSNGHGSGWALKRAKSRQIIMQKGYFEKEHAIDAVLGLNIQPDDEFVFHARIRTDGPIDVMNCHPFVLNKAFIGVSKGVVKHPVLFHNGIIHSYNNRYRELSDTGAFAYDVFSDYKNRLFFRNFKDSQMIKEILGWSKLAVMYTDREMEFWGNFIEEQGWQMSNHGYCNFNEKRHNQRTIGFRNDFLAEGVYTEFID